MSVVTYEVGDGTLKLGPAGVKDISCQVEELAIDPSEVVKTTDARPVLCGGEIPKKDVATVDWKMVGKIVQDLAAAGVVAYTWDNAGEELDFEFIPSTAGARKVTGVVRIVPIKLGGAVKTEPNSDISWQIIGTPVLGDVV